MTKLKEITKVKKLIIVIVILFLPVFAVTELIKSNHKPTPEEIASINNAMDKYFEDHPE